MAAHVEALNAGNESALTATLHFPHYRLSGKKLKAWEGLTIIGLIFLPVLVMTSTTLFGTP